MTIKEYTAKNVGNVSDAIRELMNVYVIFLDFSTFWVFVSFLKICNIVIFLNSKYIDTCGPEFVLNILNFLS